MPICLFSLFSFYCQATDGQRIQETFDNDDVLCLCCAGNLIALDEQKKQRGRTKRAAAAAAADRQGDGWLLSHPDNCVNRKRTLKTAAAAVIDLIHHHCCYCCCSCGQPQPETNHPLRDNKRQE